MSYTYDQLKLEKQKAKRRKRRLVGLLAALVVLLVCVLVLAYKFGWFSRIFQGEFAIGKDEISVTFINVGQGDSALIVAGDTSVLIDAGDAGASDAIIAALAQNGVRELDYLILSHPHADHIGGARAVIYGVRVSRVIAPSIPTELVPTNSTYVNLMLTLSEENIPCEPFLFGNVIDLDKGYIEVLAPFDYTDYDGLNNHSLVLRYIYGTTVFLFTGDCEYETEFDLIDEGLPLVCDVLKVGHHGSRYSSTRQFLAAAAPDYAVISCGQGNSYGYPHQEVLDRLADCGATVFRTDTQGNIRFVSDGKEVRFIQ